MTKLRPSRDITAADWITADLTTFAKSVHSLVPACFSSYVRVFHPARRGSHGDELVSWAEIAEANGTTVNPAMQLNALTGGYWFEPQPGVYGDVPALGTAPPEVMLPLIAVLADHTATASTCWFAFWNGYGGTTPDIRSASTFKIPSREYHLLAGPIDAAANDEWGFRFQSPNLWWPDDRAWCVATEIDLNTTYIGCDDACRDALLGTRQLEALPIEATAGIDYSSDPINPLPEEQSL
jgi:hypothetical protein